MSAGGLCVYTALTGGYERLNEQPMARQSGLRFICLTDDPGLRSDTWECRVIQPTFWMDPVRSQRDLKIRPHLYLPEFEASTYIDNSVILEQPPEALWAARDTRAGLCLPRHTGRATLLDEFVAVARLSLDDSARIFEQLNHYTIAHPELLEEPVWWTAILLRQHHRPEVRRFGEAWAAHVLRYSRRDQLSVNLAIRAAGLIPYVLPLDNRRSTFHRWPETPGRARDAGPRNAATSLMPLVARLHRLEEREAEATVLRRSLPWRATEPLRWLGRRLPLLRVMLPRGATHRALALGRDLPVLGPQLVKAELTRRFVKSNGRPPRLDPPVSFNDHMLARILQDRDPRFPAFCDKLAMRQVVGRTLGSALVLPLLGTWDDAEAVDWRALPERFVLKSNHGSGKVALVRGPAERDSPALAAKARRWLAADHYDASLEWGYRGIPRRLLAEPMLRGPDGGPLVEIEVYAFAGHVALLRVIRGEKGTQLRRERWYDRAGTAVPMTTISPVGDVALDEADRTCVVDAAETLSTGFTQLRVDFVLTEAGLKVLEVTPYAMAGHAHFVPASWDGRLGRI
ncbi:ATP-grasp fold amidoligase family protein [Falsiroseomonas sp.]|uniref:ATP-grasp fold amidoligase family protein n=1 Tax=Falsiroseomonas sp. TaxID=2870721 RepID=UPI003F717E62